MSETKSISKINFFLVLFLKKVNFEKEEIFKLIIKKIYCCDYFISY